MLTFFKQIFVWWNQQTLGTRIQTILFGKFVGKDSFGNKYYENKNDKRWVIYNGEIDATKISPNTRLDYNILYARLERMKYSMEHFRPWEWDPLWTVDEIHNGIYILSECVGFEMDVRVESVQSRLKEIPHILDQSKSSMTAHSELHISYANDRIDKLRSLLEQLPLKLNSDNLTLDKIDLLIKEIFFDIINNNIKYL